MAKEHRLPRVGITGGDINGISYEVVLKALSPEGITELFTPVVFANGGITSYYRKNLGMEEFKPRLIKKAADAEPGQVNLVEIGGEVKVEPGNATAEGGRVARLCLDAAIDALKNREIDVLVTAPINKEAMKMAGFPFPGHTEYLQQQLAEDDEALMLLCKQGGPRVALVTMHLPLAQVAGAVTKEEIVSRLRTLHNTLRKDFAIERPKIAVLSLNPHAGDGGLLGTEEQEIITPAIEEAYSRKIMAFGPFAADGFFGARRHEKYDAVLAMYHDQGLAPFKMLAMEEGVNFTAGLPFVRTSPDHGTGYDIVGKNQADPTSMRAAIYAAIDIHRRRWTYIRSKANPLKKQYVDRSGDKVKIDLSAADPAQALES